MAAHLETVRRTITELQQLERELSTQNMAYFDSVTHAGPDPVETSTETQLTAQAHDRVVVVFSSQGTDPGTASFTVTRTINEKLGFEDLLDYLQMEAKTIADANKSVVNVHSIHREVYFVREEITDAPNETEELHKK